MGGTLKLIYFISLNLHLYLGNSKKVYEEEEKSDLGPEPPNLYH